MRQIHLFIDFGFPTLVREELRLSEKLPHVVKKVVKGCYMGCNDPKLVPYEDWLLISTLID